MIGDENKFNKEKVLRFLKKYSFAFVAAVLFIVLSVTLAVSVSTPQENDKNNNEKEPVDSSAITFYLPLLNATVSKDFSDPSFSVAGSRSARGCPWKEAVWLSRGISARRSCQRSAV